MPDPTPADDADYPLTLAAALAAFQSEMPTIAKTKTATVPTKSGGSYSYSYADLVTLTEKAFPLLSKQGLAFTCLPIPLGDGRAFGLTGVLLHVSGERVEGTLPLFGNSPQEFGSALTYMRRYLLAALTGIVTEEDTDGEAGGRSDWSRTKPAAPPPPDEDPWAAAPAPADKDDVERAITSLMSLVASTEPGDTRDAAIRGLWARNPKVQRTDVTPPRLWQDDLGPGPVPWKVVVEHARTVTA